MVYSVIKADLGRNREMILSVWNRNAVSDPERRYSWVYLQNPAGPPEGWLVTTLKNGVVGSTGLALRQMSLDERSVWVGQAIDLVVDKDHRTAGPALQLQKGLIDYVKKSSLSLVYGFPNQRSDEVLSRAGYKFLGNFQRWTRPLRSGYRVKGFSGLAIAEKAVSSLLDLTTHMLWGNTAIGGREGIKTGTSDQFDSRFDSLWSTASRNFSIVGDRGSTFLKWRFQACPERNYRIFWAANAKEELLGYVVFTDQGEFTSISDLLFSNIGVLDILLPEFIHYIRLEGKSAISMNYLGSDRVTKKLREYGFFKRSHPIRVLVYVNGDLIRNSEAVMDRNRWYLTDADKDV